MTPTTQNLPDQPDGISDESTDLPALLAAAERVQAYIVASGDGLYDVSGGAPLYARDLEVLSRAVLRPAPIKTGLALAPAALDQRGVAIGDLVHVPRGVDVVCETGYRIRVTELSGYGPSGPRIKANGQPMVSRSVTSETGFVERVIPWNLIPQCTVTKPETVDA